MAVTRPRVVPPFPKRGVYAAAFVLGVLLAPYWYHGLEPLMSLLNKYVPRLRNGFLPLMAVGLILALAPFAASFVVLARVEGRARTAAVAGAVCAMAAGAAMLLLSHAESGQHNLYAAYWAGLGGWATVLAIGSIVL